MFQTQYEASYSDPRNAPLVEIDYSVKPGTLSDFDFTVKEIEDAIANIPNSASPGPDNISARVLKGCKGAIALPIYLLWLKSFRTGDIPKHCKFSFVIPIFKKGKKELAVNYRPINLTSHIIKIFERIVKARWVAHLESNSMLGDFQFGFRQKKSC